MKKIITSLLVIVLCVSLVLCGCSKSEIKTKNDKELNSSIVLTVGDIKYTQADYNFIYKLLYDNMSQYAMYYGEDWINFEIEEGKTIGDFIKENTENQLKQLAAANILAKEKGIKADKDIKKEVANQKKNIIETNYGGETGFVTFLEDTRTTDKAIDTYLMMYEVYNKYYEKISSVGGEAYVEDKDLEEAFLKDYSNKLRVKHILISTQEQTDDKGETVPAKSEAEALKIANEVIGKLNAGEDFDKLIDEYDEDPGMESGGFYVFGDGEMVPEFETASKNLEIGKHTTEAVKTSYGYHIIKRYEITTDMDEFKSFKDTKMQEKTSELIEKKIKDIKVKAEEKTIDAYVEAWLKDIKKAQEAEKEVPESQPETENKENAETESEEKAE